MLLTMAAVLLAPPNPKETSGGFSAAIINVPVASERYRRTADLEAQFEKKRQQLNQQRDALRDRIERARRSLQEELKPGTDEYRARQKELALLEAELQFFVESQGRAVEQEMAKSLGAIFEDIRIMVQVVAEERNINLVLTADQMPKGEPDSTTQVRQQIMLQKTLYWNPRIDLTDEVVARLNASYNAKRSQQ